MPPQRRNPGPCRPPALVLLALLCAAHGGLAFELGPKPERPPGVIIKLAAPAPGGGPSSAASTLAESDAAVLPDTARAIDPALQLYKVEVPEGQTAAEVAAALAQSNAVEYAYADDYVHIAGGIPRQHGRSSGSGGKLGGRRLAAAPPVRRPAPLPPPRKAAAPPLKPQPALVKASPPPPRKAAASPPPKAAGVPLPLKPQPALVTASPPPPKAAASSPPPVRPPPPPPLVRPPPPAPAPPVNATAPPANATTLPPKPGPRAAIYPNDQFFGAQWGQAAIRASQAWAVQADSSSVLSCVVDTGVMWEHPDLAANLAPVSAAYRAANADDNGHGTHVAGIMGAVGRNGLGVTGAALRARILPCKALDKNGWGLISRVIECIAICRARGARVINTSFVLTEFNAALFDAVQNGTRAGVFFAAAAGNAGNDNDAFNFYPGGYVLPGNVAVANVDSRGQLAPSSNYGARSVQLAAPGTDILSTWPRRDYGGGLYASQTGTSMAAPYVSAAAALALAASGGALTNAQLAALLVATSRPLPGLRGRVAAGGVIDLEAAVRRAAAWRGNSTAQQPAALTG